MKQQSDNAEERAPQALTLLETVKSVGAAFFGVQSRKNRVRDFTKGKPVHFIVIGIVMTVVLIAVVMGVVKLILHNAGL